MSQPRRGPARVALGVALAVVSVGLGCSASPLDPMATVTVSGHVYGVMPGADVHLIHTDHADTDGINSGELTCATCEAGTWRTTRVDDAGTFSFTMKGSDTQDFFGDTRSLTVFLEGRPSSVAGAVGRPGTSWTFDALSTGIQLPETTLLTEAPSLTYVGPTMEVRVPRVGPQSAPERVVLADANDNVVASVTTRNGRAHFSRRLLEDTPARVWYEINDVASGIHRFSRSPVVAVSEPVVPVSRGAACHTFLRSGRAVPVMPCGVTDGDLRTTRVLGNAVDRCDNLSGDALAHCSALAIETVQVDLARPTTVRAVVVHDGYGGLVEVSTDVHRFVPFGRATSTPQAFTRPFARIFVGLAHSVVAVRVTGRATAYLAEVSVWS